MHANILLFSNDRLGNKKKTNREIAESFDISLNTVNQVRRLYSTQGLDAAINRKTRISPDHISKITGDFEAHVISVICMDEKQKRIYLATEAMALGRGGIRKLSVLTGVSQTTIIKGKKEIISGEPLDNTSIRSSGSGRKK